MKIEQKKFQHIFIKMFEPLAAIMFMIVLLVGSNFFISPKIYADGEDKYVLKMLEYAIDGDFGIVSAFDNNLCFDIEGGMKTKDKVSVIAFPRHYSSNQKFSFYAIDQNSHGYVYSLAPTYTASYVLDVDSCSSEDGAKIQLYSSNNTNAQKFVIKEVYERIGSEEKFRGYIILTASSNFKKALSFDDKNKIIQSSINMNDIQSKQIWFLEKGFSGYCYSQGGYRDVDKVQGKYNAINYSLSNDNGGYYLNTDYWSKYEDFLSVRETASWNPRNARITQYGYTLFGSVDLDININNALGERFGLFYYIGIGYDESNIVNSKYTNGVVGYGCVEVEYTDTNNKTFSIFTNNALQNPTNKLNYNTLSNSYTFNKCGKYTIRVYYKVKASLVTYVMKEFSFYIGSTSSRCDALMPTEDMGTEYENKDKNRVLSTYSFSVNQDNEIEIAYDGDEEYRAKDEELINYITNSYYLSEEEKRENINKFIEQIKTFNEYKIYFTNTAFFMSSGDNDFAQIITIETGFDKTTSTLVTNRTKTFVADGIYEFISNNKYSFGIKNYYRVLLQSEPNKQVFRNVTYCYKDENDELINYAIDYAFLEDLKIFPYTMTLSITYANITNESNKCEEIEYQSNSIIYNTTKEVLKLRFTIKDISGNKTVIYLNIFPSLPPTLNKKNLQNESYQYNYNSNGFSIKLYDSEQKKYKNNLFSSKDVALQNFLTNILESQDICERDGEKYCLKYNPDGLMISTIQFDSNQQLIEYLYQLFENNVFETSLSYEDAQEYRIPEKAMHYETLYLNKDFYFITDSTFPLFESYKIYFKYYSQEGKLLKDGLITYNGDYKYGDTMFHILASDNESDWQSGYVDFVEYNISSNKGNEYTAYIVNSNPMIVLRERQGTKYEKHQYCDQAEISCEEFLIENTPSAGETYIIEDQYSKTILNSHNFKPAKFNKAGDYKITIENTHEFKYEIKINVYSLQAFFDGVENFGVTENDVVFKTENLNFKCYINGKLQNNQNYEYIDGEYRFVFKKSSEDKNIYVIKDFMQFAFVIRGDTEFDLSPYYSSEVGYATPNVVREYRRNIQNYIESINSHILAVKNAIYDIDNSNVFNLLNIQNGQYDTYLSIKNNNYAIAEKEEAYLNSLLKSQNILLKQNKNYNKIYILKDLIEELKTKSQKYNDAFVEYGCKYFELKGISLPQNILTEIKDLTEQQIISMHEEFLDLSSQIDEQEFTVLSLNKQIKEILQAKDDYARKIDYVNANYTQITKLTKLLEISDDLDSFEKLYLSKAFELKKQLNNVSCIDSSNIFVSDKISNIKLQKQSGLNLIEEIDFIDLSTIKFNLKKSILLSTRQMNQDMQSYMDEVEQKLNEYVQTMISIQDEKSWWKIFSNKIREKQIKEIKLKIRYLYNEYTKFVESNENNLVYVKQCLEKSLENNPEIIEKDLVCSIDKTLENLRNLLAKVSSEAL